LFGLVYFYLKLSLFSATFAPIAKLNFRTDVLSLVDCGTMSFYITFYASIYEFSSYSQTNADVQVYGGIPTYVTVLIG